MSSQYVDNSGQFHSQGSQLVGNSINTHGGSIYLNALQTVRNTESFQLGLHFGDAPLIDSNLFVGRSSELHKIEEILHPHDSPQEQRRLVLGGLGGIGKTQLIIAYARQYRNSYGSIFWLNATSELSLHASLRLLAARLEAQDLDRLKDTQILSYIHNWLSSTKNPRWLLLFDNYDDPKDFNLTRYFPYAAHGSIIITTRVPDLMPFTASCIRVQPLGNVEEGFAILQKRSQRENVITDPDARQLVERLAGIPLALASAGAYLSHSASVSFQQYLQTYDQSLHIDSTRPLHLQEYQKSTLHAAWNLSYARLVDENPNAAQLLKLLAYFDNQKIWYELLSTGDLKCLSSNPKRIFPRIGLKKRPSLLLQHSLADRIRFDAAMRTLIQYCFVEVQTTAQSYSLHNSVHDWILGALNTVIDTKLYCYASSCIASSICEDWMDLAHLQYNRFVPHAVRLTNHRFMQGDLFHGMSAGHLQNSYQIANLLVQQLQFSAAESMFRRVLAAQETLLGRSHLDTLSTVHNFSILYGKQGRWEEAEQMNLRALAGEEKVLGPDDPDTLATVHNLGILCARQGRLDEAEQMYMRALAGKEKVLGPDHPGTLMTVHNLGGLYINQGRLDDAEQMYMRALAEREKVLGPDHPNTLATVNNLGILCARQGRLDEAEQMYMRALVGCESQLGQEHSDTRKVALSLARLYRKQGKEEQAAEIEERYHINKG